MNDANKHTGFTLIELLTVIAIIAILMATVQPMITASASRAREFECQSHLKEIGMAMQAYAQDQGVFPAKLVSLDVILRDKSLLECPATSALYYYRNPGRDADRDRLVAACIDPASRPDKFPHRFGSAYFWLTAGGHIEKVRGR